MSSSSGPERRCEAVSGGVQAAFKELEIRHEIERKNLGREQRRARIAATEPHKVAEELYLRQWRDQYVQEIEHLRGQQHEEQAELQAAWRERNDERRAAFHALSEGEAQDRDTSAERRQEQGLTLDLSLNLSNGPRRDGPG